MTTNPTPEPKPRKRDRKAEYRARMAKTGGNYNKIRRAQEAAIVKPTQATASSFQTAYDTFNRELFNRALPQCMITLRTFGKARGYFSPDRFVSITEVSTVHEIALDPRQFMDRAEIEILSTLAHEMCHLWQREHGSPSRAGYHNAEWATKMRDIGLEPSSTGEPGGKTTGQQMIHYIAPGGRFETVAQRLVASGKAPLRWSDIEGFLMVPPDAVPTPLAGVAAGVRTRTVSTKAGKRVKYICPDCTAAVWGKGGLLVACAGSETETHDPILMLA
jgi:predicted SprT family Zn-dependent metalloprotease